MTKSSGDEILWAISSWRPPRGDIVRPLGCAYNAAPARGFRAAARDSQKIEVRGSADAERDRRQEKERIA
jgi:hypothetical protein